MPPRSEAGDVPQWDALFADALGQAGYFTTRQAALRHVSARLLSHHLKSGRLDIAARSIFRFHQFPSEPHDELVPLWLWSGREGLFSHETALALRNLSDVLPVAVSMTLPAPWARRRLKAPQGLVLHFGDVEAEDRAFVGPVPVTGLLRTLNDCASIGVEPQFLRQAVREAVSRGQLLRRDVTRLSPLLQGYVPSAAPKDAT